MDKDQQLLISLLSIGIRGKKFTTNEIGDVDWRKIFRIAKEQDIYTLVYPIVKDIEGKFNLQNEIVLEWKKNTILSSLVQIHNINKIISLLKILNEAEIQVMGLKGLVLRELYPVKELRTMGDIDILIHIEDLDKAEKILLDLGYFEDHRDSKHIFFSHKNFLPIELHWLLFAEKISEYCDYIETTIWENTGEINLCGATVIVPSFENQILHLCLHMAWHFKYSGFGLRQLCDLVVLVEAEGQKVNWNSFYEKVKRCKVENFVLAIFEICRKIFDMVVPSILNSSELGNSEYIDMILDNIFVGGVHGGIYGMSSLGPADGNLLSYYESNNRFHKRKDKFKHMLGFLFPGPQSIANRYSYARQYPFIIPIAWLHRLIYGILRRDFNTKQKSFLLLAQSDFYSKRTDLLKWLGF